MKRIFGLLAALLFAAAPIWAAASPLPYVNAPFDTPNAASNLVVTNLNNNLAPLASLTACTGTTTATCIGNRFSLSITGLSTAASTLAAAVTVTDTNVTAVSQVLCFTNIYAGTGIPIPVNVVPAAGTFTFQVLNVATGAALNAAVPVQCLINN